MLLGKVQDASEDWKRLFLPACGTVTPIDFRNQEHSTVPRIRIFSISGSLPGDFVASEYRVCLYVFRAHKYPLIPKNLFLPWYSGTGFPIVKHYSASGTLCPI